ncbi:unannotated protein [freshwater metagenome]|uniref:Unannotated protein n=1 Tax=freshwater metagenome TaxID=449393 RepID=A0A6J7KBU0_9ZZZZ
MDESASDPVQFFGSAEWISDWARVFNKVAAVSACAPLKFWRKVATKADVVSGRGTSVIGASSSPEFLSSSSKYADGSSSSR